MLLTLGGGNLSPKLRGFLSPNVSAAVYPGLQTEDRSQDS